MHSACVNAPDNKLCQQNFTAFIVPLQNASSKLGLNDNSQYHFYYSITKILNEYLSICDIYFSPSVSLLCVWWVYRRAHMGCKMVLCQELHCM